MTYVTNCFILFVIPLTLGIAREPNNDPIVLCPGSGISLNCSQEPPRSGITWRIWCQCNIVTSSEMCEGTCTAMIPSVIDTGNQLNQGIVCEHVTYSITFTTIEENGNILVPSSVLDIAIPLDFNQEAATTLCVECQRQFSRQLIVPGPPFLPNNFTFIPDYTTSTDSNAEVNLMWLPAPEQLSELDVEYNVVITELNSSIILYNCTTSSTNFTARLEFNTTYSITLYASTCNCTLISQTLVTNIIIIEEEATPGANNITTLEGISTMEPTNTTTTVTECSPCISPVLSAVISVSAVLMTLFLNVITFTLGVLVGVCRMKTRQQASTTVSAAQSERASADMSETTAGVELERVHDYEDIVLVETRDINTFTTNVAYSYTQQQ